ncbi:hypothetical protein CQW31_00235 [Pseudomonas sp. 382]|nr:hypothetical protein CQW31_00235 [Pseudomonas sp. 382]
MPIAVGRPLPSWQWGTDSSAPASSRVNPLPQGNSRLETCDIPVGAGLPAKGPQSGPNGPVSTAPVLVPRQFLPAAPGPWQRPRR